LYDHLPYKLAIFAAATALKMANECAYASPASAWPPLSDGENKENQQEAGVNCARSSKNETP